MQLAVPLLAVIAAVLSYRFFDTWTARTWLPAGLRALGWGLLSLLLLNQSCPGSPTSRAPLVLLDASLSMQAAGGRWAEALELARELGEVRLVGVPPGDTLPTGGNSRLQPAIISAQASGRPVVLVTDGEVEDGAAIRAGPLLPAIRLLPRRAVPDIALTRVTATPRLGAGDSLRVEIEVQADGFSPLPGGRRVRLEVRHESRVWIRGAVVLDSGGRGRTLLAAPLPAVPAGSYALRVVAADAADAEPRTDARMVLIHIAPTPGIVVLASPPSWESRFLIATLREVTATPVRGYLEIEPGAWRRSGDLGMVSGAELAAAARQADLLVTMGSGGEAARSSRARPRARWNWLGGSSVQSGDWYLSATEATPLSGPLAGIAIDSFPPGTGLVELTPRPGDWVGVSAQAGRRGTPRPGFIGGDSSGVRRVITGIEGLWRWAFRGGASEQGYRAMIAAAASWLLSGRDSAVGRARLEREVVARGTGAVFRWAGGGNPIPLGVEFTGSAGTRRDTLRFDGTGRAEVMLPPGVWPYRLDGGGQGTLVVEDYSEELLPRPVVLSERSGTGASEVARRPVRALIWMFGLAMAAFAGEWTARRRLGLR